jgi:hypothetical protein
MKASLQVEGIAAGSDGCCCGFGVIAEPSVTCGTFRGFGVIAEPSFFFCVFFFCVFLFLVIGPEGKWMRLFESACRRRHEADLENS